MILNAKGERACGTCSMCCRVLGVPEMPEELGGPKPAGKWCQHCEPGSGASCKVYTERPRPCRDFQCLWLKEPRGMPDAFRPDRIKVMLAAGKVSDVIAVHCTKEHPDAWHKAPFVMWLHKLLLGGIGVGVMIDGVHTLSVQIAEGKFLVELVKPLPNPLLHNNVSKADGSENAETGPGSPAGDP